MRLVSYNILNGGHGRADPIAEVLLAQKPDIIALVEADDTAILNRIARRLSMDYVHAQGEKKSVALLSRWKLVQTINHAVLHPGKVQSLLEAMVRDPQGHQWLVGVVHLPGHARAEDEARRQDQMQFVLDVFASYRKAGRAHLLAGDFNSTSPIQKIDLSRCKPETREEAMENGGDLHRDVVRTILDAGYMDLMEQVNEPEATAGGTFSTQWPGQRVDYVFGWGFKKQMIRRAWVERDRLAKYASDHYPVAVEVEYAE